MIDICSNFINCKEWKAGDEVLDILLESALLPLLESAFRNGSWLEMAKENEVYHSYLGKTYDLNIYSFDKSNRFIEGISSFIDRNRFQVQASLNWTNL